MTIAGIVLFIIVCGFVVIDPNKNPIGITLVAIALVVIVVANWASIKRYFTRNNTNKGEGSE